MSRPIYQIADEVHRLWRPAHPTARPYLDAMRHLSTMEDRYIHDSASSVVSYFLANASSFKGDDARRIKAELNAMLKEHRR